MRTEKLTCHCARAPLHPDFMLVVVVVAPKYLLADLASEKKLQKKKNYLRLEASRASNHFGLEHVLVVLNPKFL